MLQPPKLNKFNAHLVRQSGRSWWQVHYDTGKIISEWETAQGISFLPTASASRTSRWEEIPKVGIRGVYLLCPNGRAAALEANGEFSFFQFKSGIITVGGDSPNQTCQAHIIGKVDGDDGRCVCYAWEYLEKRLIRFEDNVTNLRYRNIGPLGLGEAVGVK